MLKSQMKRKSDYVYYQDQLHVSHWNVLKMLYENSSIWLSFSAGPPVMCVRV
jgi:hypothetical protein